MAAVAGKIAGLVGMLAKEAQPRLATFVKYAKVELTPPSPGEIGKAVGDLKQLANDVKCGAYKQLTVKEATVNGLIVVEVLCWFWIGECIGKRHLVGYDV